jgi:hypothetical protein
MKKRFARQSTGIVKEASEIKLGMPCERYGHTSHYQ